MECNKEEAMRAKEIAESRMLNKDFVGARKVALKAQKLYPDLESISHIILVCDVHCSSENKVCGDEKDWYKILNIDPSADESSIKKQYRKYALSLHPDKNNFAGSTDAFKLIGEARKVLLDPNKRSIYDSKYKASREHHNSNVPRQTGFNNHSVNNGSRTKYQQSQRHGQTGVSKEATFWTVCSCCCIKSQFPADLVNRSVWCQTCKLYFTAEEISVPPTQKKEKKPKKWLPKKNLQRDCKNSTPKGVYQENNSNGKRTRESAQTRESSEINKKFKSVEKCGNVGVKTDRGNVEQENNSDGKRTRQSVQMRESSEITKKFKSVEKCANVGVKTDKGNVEHRPQRCTQSKLHAYFNKCLTGGQFSEQETPEVKTADRHFSHVKDDIDEVKLSESCSFKGSLRNEDEGHVNANRKIESTDYGHKSTAEVYLYPDPDFSNFKENRREECFQIGQIWAVYDTIDAMPRFYALIKEVLLPGFKMIITWLEPDPVDKEQVIWVNEGLPASCGRFKFGDSEIIDDHLMFSHLVHYDKESGSDICRIYPKARETWAIFKNWDRNWQSDQDIKKKEFEYVEILSDYAEETGVSVSYLGKTKGFSCLFCQAGKGGDSFQILPDQIFRFSHRVPSVRMTGDEREDVPEGSFELDPSSLSSNIEEFHVSKFAIHKMGTLSKSEVMIRSGISCTCIDSNFNNFEKNKTEECFTVGQVWALYDCLDAMPRFYALLEEVSFSPVFKVRLTWLEPDPSEKEEIKWVSEGLPVSCGKFVLGNSETIEDLLMFSHLVSGGNVGENETYKIYPKEGETWALFKEWNIKWNSNAEVKKSYQFEFVEVLSDYDVGLGVSVAYLHKVNGFSCVFSRAENERSFQIPPNDIFRFSHRVPSFQMNGVEQRNVPQGSFELDPGALHS